LRPFAKHLSPLGLAHQGNILPASTAAPALQAHQKELERHFKADTLNDKIAHRPSPDELIKKGVLDEDPRSPEEKYAEAIEVRPILLLVVFMPPLSPSRSPLFSASKSRANHYFF
jgi:hypothetical protein